MPDAEAVLVERPKCFGPVKNLLWKIQGKVIDAVQSKWPGSDDFKKIATTIAHAIPTKQLKEELNAKEANPKACKKPIVVVEMIHLSLPERKREPYYVELRVIDGVVEVHPQTLQQIVDLKKIGHA